MNDSVLNSGGEKVMGDTTDEWFSGAPRTREMAEQNRIFGMMELCRDFEREIHRLSDSPRDKWIDTDAEKPLHEQIVLAYWPKNRYLRFPLVESLQYHADQSGHGDAWIDAHGEESDPPAYWKPQPDYHSPEGTK